MCIMPKKFICFKRRGGGKIAPRPNEMGITMESTEIINRIQDAVKMLPPQKLEIALDFLEDLKISDEAETEVLLNEPGFLEEYRQAKDDIQSGNTVSWKDIRRDV